MTDSSNPLIGGSGLLGGMTELKESTMTTKEIQLEETEPVSNVDQPPTEPIPGDEPLPPEIVDGPVDARYLWNLWDGLTHCAEPKGSAVVMQKLEDEIKETEPYPDSSAFKGQLNPQDLKHKLYKS